MRHSNRMRAGQSWICAATVLAALSMGVLFSCASAPGAPEGREKPVPATDPSLDTAAAIPEPSADGVGGPRSGPGVMAEIAPPPALKSAGSPGSAPRPASPAGAPSAAPLGASAASPAAPRPVPGQSGLKAGFSDDNAQFNLYLKFLDQFKHVPHEELAVEERILLSLRDADDKPVADAAVIVRAEGKTLGSGRSYSDGVFALYPREYRSEAGSYELEIRSSAGEAALRVDRAGPRQVRATLPGRRAVRQPLPVDIVFVLDTTGSMGEEIERLRDTIEIIKANVEATRPRPALRFGLVLYKDRDDEYLTKVQPLTADLAAFQAFLAEVDASGGGDTPEDLQAALKEAVRGMSWNKEGLRLAFVITDAPAQLGYGQSYTYAEAAREAAAKAVKLFGIGTGGLPVEGEYLLRQLAQFTRGKYIFLTYGERGESEGGAPGSVSHHTGSNFVADKLEAVIIKFVREEMARFGDLAQAEDEAYFEARKIASEEAEATLEKLFGQAMGELVDYASMRIEPGSTVAVAPLGTAAGSPGLASQAEYLTERIFVAAAKEKAFALVERKDIQKILEEIEFQLSGLADPGKMAEFGKLLGAELLITGSVHEREDRFEVFLKLLRVQSGEVLSATKARIDRKLGL